MRDKVIITRQLRRKQIIDFFSNNSLFAWSHGSLRNRLLLGA